MGPARGRPGHDRRLQAVAGQDSPNPLTIAEVWADLHSVSPRGWFVGRPGRRQGLRHRQLITMAVIAAAVISGCFGMNRGHPEPNRVRGYGIELSLAGGPFEVVMIGANGEGCDVMQSNYDAYRTCLIAAQVNPSVLAGGEDGSDLNIRHTPAFDALVWKARADNDVTVCERGGLERDFLVRCENEARANGYLYNADGIRVRVPIGGAEPTSTHMTG